MQNVQGLSIEKFNNLLHNVFTIDYDLICLQETWLKSLDITNFEVPDYVCINPDHLKAKELKEDLVEFYSMCIRGYSNTLSYKVTVIQRTESGSSLKSHH